MIARTFRNLQTLSSTYIHCCSAAVTPHGAAVSSYCTMVPPVPSDVPQERYVNHFFTLSEDTKKQLRAMTPKFGFGGFGETVYYRTYSRKKADGSQEQWNDTVTRVVEGALSIRKVAGSPACLSTL